MADWLTRLEFFDGKFARLTVTAHCFVDASICSTTDETDHFITVNDPDFTLISHVRAYAPITRI